MIATTWNIDQPERSTAAVFATGTFTEDDAEEFTEALAAGLLDDIYSLE